VLDSPASDTYGFLWRDTCISSTQLNKPKWNKESVTPPSKSLVAESIPFQNLTQFLHGTML
jgi:hypothetical protein